MISKRVALLPCPPSPAIPRPSPEIGGAPSREDGSVPLQGLREAAVWFLARSARLGVSNQVLVLSAPHSLIRVKSLSSLSLTFPIRELGWVDAGIFRTARDCVTVESSQSVSEQRHDPARVDAHRKPTSSTDTYSPPGADGQVPLGQQPPGSWRPQRVTQAA